MNYVRVVDDLGRVALPVEFCVALDIDDNDQVDVSFDGGKIILQKHVPGCIICSGADDAYKYAVHRYKEKPVCGDCNRKLSVLD